MQLLKIALPVLVLLVAGCDKPDVEPASEAYTFPVPAHFPTPVFDTQNEMTVEGIALGRRLFYDVRLSGNNKVSCASCHEPGRAFTDGVALSSAGVSGTVLLRHAPALFNIAWANTGLFWDGGSTNLESQVFGPLTAHDEMGQDLYELVNELNAEPAYVTAFESAFGEEISSQNISKALAQFQRSLVSAGSRYDKYRLGQPGGTLNADELAGLKLVKAKCQGCHAGELFTDFGYHNNGIDQTFENTVHEGIYQGRYRISYNKADLGSFKTPSLRNLAFTAPYMHDGRFATLEQVLDHYSDKIKPSQYLDAQLPAGGLGLSAGERKQILAFLATLTDNEFVNNKDHQKPAQ